MLNTPLPINLLRSGSSAVAYDRRHVSPGPYIRVPAEDPRPSNAVRDMICGLARKHESQSPSFTQNRAPSRLLPYTLLSPTRRRRREGDNSATTSRD
jgi:hypothetical protein